MRLGLELDADADADAELAHLDKAPNGNGFGEATSSSPFQSLSQVDEEITASSPFLRQR